MLLVFGFACFLCGVSAGAALVCYAACRVGALAEAGR